MNRFIFPIYFLLCTFLTFPTDVAGQSKSRHYVQAHLVIEEDGSRSRETVTYYDSFDLQYETLEVDATPQGKDLQTPIGYDVFSGKRWSSFPVRSEILIFMRMLPLLLQESAAMLPRMNMSMTLPGMYRNCIIRSTVTLGY